MNDYDLAVAAVVVTYNGGPDIENTILAVCDQVDRVIVVDNGSSADTLNVLHSIGSIDNVDIILLGDNFGIARAQNIGFVAAKKIGVPWILMLDQDSYCAQNMVAQLLSAALMVDFNTLGFVCPSIDLAANDMGDDEVGGVVEVDAAISSGCLFPVRIYETIGGLKEEYFIDAVDFEYCLRLRSNGLKMYRVPSAILRHRLGQKRMINFLLFSFEISEHSPLRRYYLYRNHVFLIKEYWNKFPFFLIKKSIFSLILLLQMILFESSRGEKLKLSILGVVDGIMGRFGKCTR